MTLKFKNRIALFNTLAVAITTTLLFFVIYFVVKKTAYAHLDKTIQVEHNEVLSNLGLKGDSIIIKKMPEWEEAEHSQIEVNPTFLQIEDMEGVIIFHSVNLLKNQVLADPLNEQETFYNGVVGGKKIRLGKFPIVNKGSGIIGHLTIAVSQEESYTILTKLFWILIVSFPLLLVIQFVASSLAAARAIGPVHQLIRSASDIGDSNISTRLGLPERKDELYKLTETINELLGRIESSMLQQKQFTSDASHEMRTPLAAIRGTLEVLIRKQRDPEMYEEKISGIIDQVDRLDRLLDKLLQLARIESGVVLAKRERVHLAGMISALEEKLKKAAAEKKISLHIHIPECTMVIGDKLYLELIIENIISNAIKYGKVNGNVFLIWNEELKTLSVEDDGIGIAAEHLPKIFNRFYRADESRNSAFKGTGLGLSIVKKLADLQNITLVADSRPGAGSIITLQFPL